MMCMYVHMHVYTYMLTDTGKFHIIACVNISAHDVSVSQAIYVRKHVHLLYTCMIPI